MKVILKDLLFEAQILSLKMLKKRASQDMRMLRPKEVYLLEI